MRQRVRAAVVVVVLGLGGCANLLGVDFSGYEEDRDAGGEAAICIVNQVLRCSCGSLDEGTQMCIAGGSLSPCVCDDSSLRDQGLTAGCGNGSINTPEACDDGNKVSGDGCSATCVPDGRPSSVEACPGQSVVVWPGSMVNMTLQGFVRGDSTSDAASCQSAMAPDRVYAIVAPLSGTLDIGIASNQALAFSVRSTCADPSSAVSCDAVPASGPAVLRQIPITSQRPVFLIIEPRAVSPTAAYTIDLAVH